jgi:hypothetical protein
MESVDIMMVGDPEIAFELLNVKLPAHYDFITNDAEPFASGHGNRIATALFYV